jgi:hypothetical protein
LFVVLHLGVMLATGLPNRVRDAFWPAIAWYADGLRMTNRFGMFAKPPKKTVLVVVGRRASGDVDLATSASSQRDFTRRIVDARLRKLQDKLLEPAARQQWGDVYLGWYCRSDPELARVSLELRAPDELDDAGRVKRRARRAVLLVRRCAPAGGNR